MAKKDMLALTPSRMVEIRKLVDTMDVDELFGLNAFVCSEISARQQMDSMAKARVIKAGDKVTYAHLGMSATVEKINRTTATCREIGGAQRRYRIPLTMLELST